MIECDECPESIERETASLLLRFFSLFFVNCFRASFSHIESPSLSLRVNCPTCFRAYYFLVRFFLGRVTVCCCARMQRQVLSSFFLFLLLSTALRAGSRVDATAVEDSATTRIRLLVKKHSSASSSSTTTTSSSSSSSSSDEKSTTARTPTHAEAAAAAAAVPTGVTWRTERELVEVQAWGLDSIRVTFTNGRGPIDSGALGAVLAKPELEAPPSNRAGHVARHSPSAARYRESASASSSPLNALVDVKISPDGTSGNVTNGGIRAVVAPVAACCSGGGAAGLQAIGIVFVNASTGTEILREFYPLHGQPARVMHPMARGSGSLMSAAVSFAGYENERLFGLGQHQHGKLDQSGFVIDLDQFNTEVRSLLVLQLLPLCRDTFSIIRIQRC